MLFSVFKLSTFAINSVLSVSNCLFLCFSVSKLIFRFDSSSSRVCCFESFVESVWIDFVEFSGMNVRVQAGEFDAMRVFCSGSVSWMNSIGLGVVSKSDGLMTCVW